MRPQGRHRLYTWSWRAALAEDVSDRLVLVRTSVGKPRWVPSAVSDSIPFMGKLAPFGLLNVEPWAEFERRYVARLEKHGVAVIEAEFREIAAANDGLPLVLLCFEPVSANCHRSIFARWWLEQTGEIVPEWSGGA